MVRNAIKQDLLFVLIPAFLLFSAGMGMSGRDLARRWQPFFIPSIHTIAGVILIGGGLIMIVAAAITLRRNYSATLVIRKGHQLIRHGLYRTVRHPLYLGVLMISLGVPVFAWSWRGFLLMTGLIPLILYRIRLEEALLEAEFGEAYRSYRANSRKLIPYLH